MNPMVEIAQCLMHGTMPRNARHWRKGGSADQDLEMTFARSVVAGMAGMAMAFVHHLKSFRCEGRRQPCLDFILHSHFSLTPFYPPSKALNSRPRVGKAPE